MSSSESDNEEYEPLGEFDEFHLDNEGLQPFMFQPMYTEAEIEERLRRRESSDQEMENREQDEGEMACVCNTCIDMNVEKETLCCVHSLKNHSNVFQGKECVTETRGFTLVCLEKEVLETALGAWHKLVGEKKNLCNRSYRFMAYKQYIWWIYGKLGKDNRMRIPTCVLYKIRKTFPASDNIYVPFSFE